MQCSVHRLICILFLAVIAPVGCSSEEELPPSNQPPTAELTSGPVEGGNVSYYVRISWTGSDPDGFITRYEYVVDPSAEFSETEINEGGPGVSAEMIPGAGDNPAVTRISKVVDGEVVFFDWIHTLALSRRFRFSTLEADSAVVDSVYGPTGRFVGTHAFYVRAIDDDEEVSIPDKVAFTAETITPESRITRPDASADFLDTGSRMIVEWEGEDPDSPKADKKPTGYYYKITDYKDPVLIFGPPRPPEVHLDDENPWIFQSAEILTTTLELKTPGFYIVGVRAVDENGAVEPFLDWGRNAFRFQAFPEISPTLILYCEAGIFSSKTPLTEFDVEIPLNTDLKYELSCSGEDYGESCSEFRWGVDISDVDRDENWSSWMVQPVLPPVLFPDPGMHRLYVQARDALGNTSGLVLLANVIDFPFDREVLFVDDSLDSTYPRDEEHDAFWRNRFEGYGGFGNVSEFHAHLEGGPNYVYAHIPRLEEMSRYRLLVWANWGAGYDGSTGLLKVADMHRTLRSYLAAGGQLWLSGRMTIAATKVAANGIQADFVYPKEELYPGDFAYDLLKLHTTKIDNDKGFVRKNTLREVNPFPRDPAVYNAMFVDPSKLNPVQADASGVSHVDTVFDPLFAESETDFRGDLDSLYVYGATGNVFLDPPKPSIYHGRLCALRWHDPDPDREHGRIQWFGFPMYYFFDDQAQDTFNKSMDWFREETAGAKGTQ